MKHETKFAETLPAYLINISRETLYFTELFRVIPKIMPQLIFEFYLVIGFMSIDLNDYNVK